MPGKDVTHSVAALESYRLSGGEVDLARLQSALSESEEWWDALFNVAGIGILLGTVTGEVVTVSPSFEALFGYTAAELRTATGILDITHPDDRGIDLELFGELVAGERDFYQLEKRYYKKDRSLMWGRLTVVLLRDAETVPRYAIAMVEDITATKMAAEVEARVHEVEAYRRQALELNDDVLQGLVVAKMAFETGDDEKGKETLASSLTALKRVIDHLLERGDIPAPGGFVRGRPRDGHPAG